MEKLAVCPRCQCRHILKGNSGMKEVAQPLTCRQCGEVFEVMWPMDQGWMVMREE